MSKSKQITDEESALLNMKLLKKLEGTYGSDTLKKLMYLDEKTVECGGESKQVAAKKLSFEEKYPYTATLTCGFQGQHYTIAGCFRDTELEVRSGDDYRLYKIYDIHEAGEELSLIHI